MNRKTDSATFRQYVKKIKSMYIIGRNEIETKRNETKTKRNETKRNENEIKRKQNEINENKTKYDARLLPTHVSVSFIRRGQDLITIEQEYYAFIQRESVLFT
jgi:hypothetical protein